MNFELLGLYAAIAALAIATRYMLALSQGCLAVGKVISIDQSGCGFQDALTPPMATKITILIWVLDIIAIGAQFYRFGMGQGFGGIGLFIVVSTIVGAVVIPKPESTHWVRIIYSSLVRRAANYVKGGDSMRADAAKMLLTRIEKMLAEKPLK